MTRELLASRPPRRQARPLTYAELARLEESLGDTAIALQDRYACGVLLFGVYARARASDLSIRSLWTTGMSPAPGTLRWPRMPTRCGGPATLWGCLCCSLPHSKGLDRGPGEKTLSCWGEAGLPLAPREAEGDPLLPAPTALERPAGHVNRDGPASSSAPASRTSPPATA